MFLTLDKIARVLLWGGVSGLLAGLLSPLGLCCFWKGFFTTWLLCAGSYLLVARVRLSVEGKAVVITGCDSGFGLATALHLHSMGFRVFAGCLHPEQGGGQKLRQRGSARLHVLQMDITKQEQVTEALHEVKRLLLPGELLWGVVNNAAISTIGAVEWVSLETVRKLHEVNVVGTVAVTKAFLPLIRQAKGRVVTIGSVRGRLPNNMGTTYDMTKYALEALNDGLRKEMTRFGVKVCLVEPGNFTKGTNIHSEDMVRHYAQSMWTAMDEEMKTAYGKNFYDATINTQLKTVRSGCPDVSQVVGAVVEALLQWLPQGRYQPMDLFAYSLVFAAQHFPEWLSDYVYLKVMSEGW